MEYPNYAPEFDIKINGDALPSPVRSAVTSVRYEDGKNAADRVEIGLANPNLSWLQSHIRGLGFGPFPTQLAIGPGGTAISGSDGVFDIDNKFELSMGYASEKLVPMFKGEVTGVNATFPNGGMPTMTLVAHDYLNRLARGSYARGFGPLADALVVAIMSAENLLVPLIDPALMTVSTAMTALNVIFGGSGTKQGRRGDGETDLKMLERIAAKYDADFWVEGDTLYFSRFFFKEYSPSIELAWGKSLLEFSPQISTVGQIASVAMKFTLRELPLSFLVSVFWDFDRETLGISVVPGESASFTKAANGPAITIADQPISSPTDIANSALVILSKLRKKLNNRLTGSGSAVGNPDIRAGAILRLDGLGPDFSGDYRVTSATHTLDTGGYRTSFQVRKEIIP
jgi:phage protein D